jgi:hypothetical protein
MTQSESYPNVAFVLSLVSGIFVILAGLFVGLVGAAFTFFIGGIGAVFGILGIVWGALILFGAFSLRSHPSQHATWGALILVFAILSWFGAFGGFFIGFILGLIGGILALVWSPQTPQTYQGTAYVAAPVASPARYCPNCGRGIPFDVKYCPYCGKEFA